MGYSAAKREKDQKKLTGLIEEALENLTENPSLPGGIPTLLDIADRRPLPPVPTSGRPSTLVQLVNECPKTYESYILALKKGAFPGPAAAAVGLSIATMRRWGELGKADFDAEKDTYYARFYQDVLKALGQCRVAVEQSIATMQPWKWLAKGPGKIFGSEWVENRTLEDEGPDPLFLQKQEEPEQLAYDGTGVEVQVLKLDTQTEAETLAEIEKAIRDRKEKPDGP